jgi:hypothetical protein
LLTNKEKTRKEEELIEKAVLEKAEREREREEEKKKRESEGMSESHRPAHRPKFTLCMHPLQPPCAAIWEGKQVDFDEQYMSMEKIQQWMGNDDDNDEMDF